MYDEELDMALESAYDDGYTQALIDMGVDPNEIAEEDVDMFDDNYFDDAMEGNAANKAAKNAYMMSHGSISDGDRRDTLHAARRRNYENQVKGGIGSTGASVERNRQSSLIHENTRNRYQNALKHNEYLGRGARTKMARDAGAALHRTPRQQKILDNM